MYVVPLPPCRIVPEPQSPAPNRRPSGMRTRAAECGEELRLSVPGEYPCVRRFRYRRLLTFLWLQGYGYTFVAMLRQTNAYLCVFHLKHLVSQGQWTEALEYIIPRFLPRVPRSPPSLEARVLVKFLRTQRLFELEVVRHLDEHSLDRRAMWARAAEIVGDLANRTPEFRDRLLLPDGPMGPQHVLPIGFGFAPFRRRRHVKKHTRPSRKLARKKHTCRVANTYFDKRMSLPSNSNSSQELAPEVIAKARDDWFRRIMEECVKAATCPELNEGRALQSSARGGTMTYPAKNSEVISTADAGTGGEVCFIKSARQGSRPRKRPAPEQPVDYLARKRQLTAGAHCEANTAQEVCFTESARQGSHPRKRPMTEQMEDCLATKKQLTAGDNGEASVKAQSSSTV
ncbi:uncharacterized protein LOC119334610 isoform X2 [Triticum dicoccoides]|uniref:uncharacterized protein LOC119334610 isoform X2 n=1 Tax=Triticum dicoccoides TaxID=85692 RepID=UPI0018901F91|nr:uncharacterized protein LOC119334610 isoform X2 [Triticum dicoccoides]